MRLVEFNKVAILISYGRSFIASQIIAEDTSEEIGDFNYLNIGGHIKEQNTEMSAEPSVTAIIPPLN